MLQTTTTSRRPTNKLVRNVLSVSLLFAINIKTNALLYCISDASKLVPFDFKPGTDWSRRSKEVERNRTRQDEETMPALPIRFSECKFYTQYPPQLAVTDHIRSG